MIESFRVCNVLFESAGFRETCLQDHPMSFV
jgi:hypothetical protein